MDWATVTSALLVVAGFGAGAIGVRQMRYLRELTHDDSLIIRLLSFDLGRHWSRP